MSLDRNAVLSTSIDSDPCHYDERAAMLYALGIGFADDGVAAEFRFASDDAPLETLPTFANALIDNAFIASSVPALKNVRHVGERLELYRPLPPAAKLLATRRISSLADLGPERGLEVEVETELRLARDHTVMATCWRSYHAESHTESRAEYRGTRDRSPARPPHRLPQREPDLVCSFRTLKNQALLFRLADPTHAAPARLAVSRPAPRAHLNLPPLCLHGIACRAVLKTICDYDFTLIDSFEARFAAPASAGETISTEMWQDGNVVSFRCRVAGRDAPVLDHGRCTLSA